MNYTLNLNSVAIQLTNCSQKHIDYFTSQFFSLESYRNTALIVEVVFRDTITIPKTAKRIEENIFFADATFVQDTKKRTLQVDFSTLSSKKLTLFVEKGFDLYYLYTFFVEPLFIIFGLDKGLLFVHSSSVAQDGNGFLFPAWRHTGKTQTLLSLTMDHSFSFMGDDYTVLDGKKMYVYPKKINLFSYNLKEHPALYEYLDSKLSLRLRITTKIKDLLTKTSYLLPGMLGKVLFRIAELAEVSTNFKTTPERLNVSIATEARVRKTAVLQASIHAQKTTALTKKEIAYKLSETIVFELSDFLGIYAASSYVAGKELNKKITSFSDNYSALVEKLIPCADVVFVDDKGKYFSNLLSKGLK